MRNRTEIIAVIPALNEANTIERVIAGVHLFHDVVVVDDGSTDNTGNLALRAGAFVVTHVRNRGYDQSLESGLLWALKEGYKYAVTIDADGQHNATTVSLFADELLAGADMVIGVRDCKQRWGESLFALISNIIWGIRDPLCGMKGYRLDLVRCAGCCNTYLSVGTELCIRAARSGCTIRQVPVTTCERHDLPRFGSGLRANLRILRALWLGLIRAQAFVMLRI